jgi:type I restriction enzyme S subunit
MSDLPRGWVTVKLADVVTPDAPIIYGILQPGPNLAKGVPYVRPTEIVDDKIDIANLRQTSTEIAARYRRSTLKADDVVLSIVGTIGKVAIVPAELDGANITQSSCRLRPDPDLILRDALASFLRSPAALSQFEALSLGTAVPRLNLEDVREIEIPLAPAAEQRRIVAKIDSLSTKSKRARDRLDHVPRLVEKYKQAILAAAFRGDLTKEWREKNECAGGWRDAVLKDIADVQSGIALGKKRSGASRLIKRPYLRVANVQRGWLDLEEIKEIEVTDQEASRLYLRPGDILMNEGGDRDKLGRGWVWEGQIANCIHQNHVFRVRLNDPAFPPKLISLYANEFGQLHFFDEGTQTTNLASISKTRLSNLPLRLPPASEGMEILQRIETAFAWIDRLASEANNARKLIDHLDQAILAKAFQGELVPHDPSDEPADVLLERIWAERSKASGMPRKAAPSRRRHKVEGQVSASK